MGMVTSAVIKIWNEVVGAVTWDSNRQIGNFQYDPNFLAKKIDLAPILMPLKQGSVIYNFPAFSRNETFKGLPGLLADVLPDKYGNQLINSWLSKNNRLENSMNPVEQLCFIGQRGMGALEIEPSKMPEVKRNFKLEFNGLIEIAKKVLSEREEFKTNLKADDQKALKDILKIGTSAGGARPKAIITYNSLTGIVKSGQAAAEKGFEHWLIKLDGVSDTQFGSYQGYGRIEMAYYDMAIDCGITMMESRLYEENGRAHFMTKRFDRENNKKHHVQTFCAMRHFDFNEVSSFSYEQLFETMRILRLNYEDAEQMFRRMAFNIIARNCDDHTKNFSFLLKKDGNWKLSPAYDVCHAYQPGSIWVSQHALSLNGKRQNHKKEDLIKFAKNINVRKSGEIIKEINNSVSNWMQFAKKYQVSLKKAKAINETLVIL